MRWERDLSSLFLGGFLVSEGFYWGIEREMSLDGGVKSGLCVLHG